MKQHTNRWLIVRMFLALIPTMLAMFITFSWIKKQRKEGSSIWQYIGPLLLALVFSYLSILFMVVGLLIILNGPIPYYGLYLSSLLIFWSMIGFTMGDKLTVKHLSAKNRIISALKNTMIERKIRIRVTILLSLMLIFLIILSGAITYAPVQIDYSVKEGVYHGDMDLINQIELFGDELGFDLHYNGSSAPIILSSNILHITRQLAIQNYGHYDYSAELKDVNTTLSNLIHNNSILIFDGIVVSDFGNFSLLPSFQLLFQKLYDPFDYGVYVTSVILLNSNQILGYITTNYGWSSLIPAIRQ